MLSTSTSTRTFRVFYKAYSVCYYEYTVRYEYYVINDTYVLKMKLLCEYIYIVSHLVLSSQYIFSLYSLSSNRYVLLQSVMTFREALSSFMTHFFLLYYLSEFQKRFQDELAKTQTYERRDGVPEHADEHAGDDQRRPFQTRRHRRGGGRTADVGVARD